MIRHAGFLLCPVGRLAIPVVIPSLLALLMACPGLPPCPRIAQISALIAAVGVTPVAAPAQPERTPTPSACPHAKYQTHVPIRRGRDSTTATVAWDIMELRASNPLVAPEGLDLYSKPSPASKLPPSGQTLYPFDHPFHFLVCACLSATRSDLRGYWRSLTPLRTVRRGLGQRARRGPHRYVQPAPPSPKFPPV